MSFAFPNEDDDDFLLSTNSNLASIFQESSPSHHSSTKSLVYTAPKQPTTPKTTSSTSVAAALAVTCYKLTNEKYEALPGKIGLALIEERETKTYRIILYQNKQKPIASVKITKEFNLSSQPDNFCTFYDDKRQNWAVLFDSKEMAQTFLDQVEKIKVTFGRENNSTPLKDGSNSKKEDAIDGSSPGFSIGAEKENKKTKLITRIAKLGQPILPLSGAVVAEESDSEQIVQSSPEPEPELTERSRPKKFARPLPPKPTVTQLPTESNHVNTMVLGDTHSFHPLVSGHQSIFPMVQYVPAGTFAGAGGTAPNNQHFETLLSETRTQNSEIRMHLCRLTDKVDHALQKVGVSESQVRVPVRVPEDTQIEVLTNLQKLQGQSSTQSDKLDRILDLMVATSRSSVFKTSQRDADELSLAKERSDWIENQKEAEAHVQQLRKENNRLKALMEELNQQHDAHLQELRQENTRLRSASEEDLKSMQQLKQENNHLKETLESIRKKDEMTINHLKEENVRLVAMMETSSQDKKDDRRNKQLEEENSRLTALVEAFEKDENNRVIKMDEKLLNYQSKSAELESRLQQFQIIAGEKDHIVKELQQQNERLEREYSRAHNLVDVLQQKLNQLEHTGSNFSISDQVAAVEERVKSIMNKTYKEVLKQFRPEESYSFQSIKSTISVVIRDVTLAALNDAAPTPMVEPTEPTKSFNDESVNTTVQEKIEERDEEVRDPLKHEEKTEPADDHSSAFQSEEVKERSVSFLETLHSSLAAAQTHHEQAWKPDPPPPPLFDDFENEDDWLA